MICDVLINYVTNSSFLLLILAHFLAGLASTGIYVILQNPNLTEICFYVS
jgi:hypothetical protein